VDNRRKSGNIVEIGMRINLGNDVLRSQGIKPHLKKNRLDGLIWNVPYTFKY